jgi:hypothetical protein
MTFPNLAFSPVNRHLQLKNHLPGQPRYKEIDSLPELPLNVWRKTEGKMQKQNWQKP